MKENAGIRVIQQTADADSLIVRTTIATEESGLPVVMVGNDTDLLVILLAHLTSTNIFIMTEINPLTLYQMSDLQSKYNDDRRKLLLAMQSVPILGSPILSLVLQS